MAQGLIWHRHGQFRVILGVIWARVLRPAILRSLGSQNDHKLIKFDHKFDHFSWIFMKFHDFIMILTCRCQIPLRAVILWHVDVNDMIIFMLKSCKIMNFHEIIMIMTCRCQWLVTRSIVVRVFDIDIIMIMIIYHEIHDFDMSWWCQLTCHWHWHVRITDMWSLLTCDMSLTSTMSRPKSGHMSVILTCHMSTCDLTWHMSMSNCMTFCHTGNGPFSRPVRGSGSLAGVILCPFLGLASVNCLAGHHLFQSLVTVSSLLSKWPPSRLFWTLRIWAYRGEIGIMNIFGLRIAISEVEANLNML